VLGMSLFGKPESKRIVLKLPERTVVKVYGPGSFLGLMNPFMTALMVRLGFWEARESELVGAMERDAQDMASQGYRIVSSQEFKMPLLGFPYWKVTFALIDAAE
jgi:hypothetical protein